MKIQKYHEYLILEGNTPEEFMDACLLKIKSKLDPLFIEEMVMKMKDFKNINLKLINDPKPDDYSKTRRTIKYKFIDENSFLYILTLYLDLKDAVNPDPNNDFKIDDIKKIHVEFTKYDNDGTTVINQLMDRTVDPSEVDIDFLINLKKEIDENEETKEEEFEIELGEDNLEEEQEGDDM